MSEKELAEKLKQFRREFIQRENDDLYDEYDRPIATYTMTNWNKLMSRLDSLVAQAKRTALENSTEQGGKKA